LLNPLWERMYHKPLAHWLEKKLVLQTTELKANALRDLQLKVLDQASALAQRGHPPLAWRQLRDDILGTFGDSARIGKPVGDDLREGKPTPMLAIALDRATQPQRDILSRVGSIDLAPDEILAIQSVFTDTGALSEVEASITLLTDQAISALDDAAITSEALGALRELAVYVGARDV
jgi:geranylgeranyl diphosphate synthase type I